MAIYSDRPRRLTPPYDDHYRYEAKSMKPDLSQWNNNRMNGLDDAWVPSASSPRNRYPPPPAPQPPPPQQHHTPVHVSPPRNHGSRSRHDVTYEQNIRYSPQRGSQGSIPFRSGYPSPVSLPSHSRSYSRPGSSHASDGPPPAPPPPPPLSFLSHVQHHRRRSSGTKSTPKAIKSRKPLWPPDGYSKRDHVSQDEAEKLISRGASTFTGHEDQVKYAHPGHYKFFTTMDDESEARTDRATFLHHSFEAMSMSMDDDAENHFPWDSLEQPSTMAAYGKSPGTTTLTFFVGKSGSLQQPVHFGSKAKARKMKLIAILERLQELQMQGLQDEEEFERTYKFLYTKLIEDPEAEHNPHYDRALQIADLLTVLSNPEWIDFGAPRNQVVAKYFDSEDEKLKRKFFHQLLLAVELHLRIESPEHDSDAKSKLLSSIPSKVAWDLALARRWLDNMLIERTQLSTTQSTFTFTLASKKIQKEALWRFAQELKWPNLDELGYILEEKDEDEKSIEDRSADAMSWFTGVILPGSTLPWLLMNTLIDCDRDTGDELNSLTHMHQNSGFQYRANTYWSSNCVVGKVLGASRGVKQVAGWIGPCYYTPELERAQCVIIKQLEPLDHRLGARDVENMSTRTMPLGPDAEDYPIHEYDLIVPDPSEVEDIIRIQKLSFVPREKEDSRGNRTHDAAIVFAFAGETLRMRLRYNIDFINAFPCTNGPHPLYHGYRRKTVRVDDGLAEINDWASRNNLSRSSRIRSRTASPMQGSFNHGALSPRTSDLSIPSLSRSNSRALLRLTEDHLNIRSRSASPDHPPSKGVKEVLVIEAFGVSDNEVFARAWCAQYGVSAVVANVRETCVACAVREAYAACVTVVILTEGGSGKEEDCVPKGGILEDY